MTGPFLTLPIGIGIFRGTQRAGDAKGGSEEESRAAGSRAAPALGFFGSGPEMSDPVKETKAQRVERLKRELNPSEAFGATRRFAREGFPPMPPVRLGPYSRRR